MNTQSWHLLGLTGLISLLSGRLRRVFSRTTIWKHQFFSAQSSLSPNFQIHTWLLSRFVIAFILRKKNLLISWLKSPSAVILELKKTKSATFSTVSPIYLPLSAGTRCYGLKFLNVEFMLAFSLYSFTLFKGLFSSSSLSAIRVASSA